MDLDCPETAIDWTIFDSLIDPLLADILSLEDSYEQYFDFQAASGSESLETKLPVEETVQFHEDSVQISQNGLQQIQPDLDSSHTLSQTGPCFQTGHSPSVGPLKPSIEGPASITQAKRPSNEAGLRRKKGKTNKGKGQKLDGYFVFSANSDRPTLQQRAPYTAARKAEVNQIRDLGACLRCKVLKKSCSSGKPCRACNRLPQSIRSSISLGWMDCVRPSLISLCIFRNDEGNWDSTESLSWFNWYLNEYRKADISILFDVPFEWNIDSVSNFLLKWIVEDAHATDSSVVGILSTTKFASMIAPLVGTRLAELSKAFLFSLSCLTNIDLPPYTRRYVRSVANSTGFEVMQELEALVSVRRLAKLSQANLSALFSVLLAAIIAIEFCDDRRGLMCDQPVAAGGNTQYASKRAELIKLLTHYMVLVTSRASGVLSSKIDEKKLLEKTSNLRDKDTVWSCAPLHGNSYSSNSSKDRSMRIADNSVPELRITPIESLLLTYQGRSVSTTASMWFPECPQFCHYPYTYSFQSHILTILDCGESQKRAAMPGSLWELCNFGSSNGDFRSQFCGHTDPQDLDSRGC